MKSNYEYRQILLENQIELEKAVKIIELMRVNDSVLDAKRTVQQFVNLHSDDKIDEMTKVQLENSIKIFSCELIEYIKLIIKSVFKGESLPNEEWEFLLNYPVSIDSQVDSEFKKTARMSLKKYIESNYKDILNSSLDKIDSLLTETQNTLIAIIKEFEVSKEAKREKRYKEILQKESGNVSNDLVAKFNIDKRVLYSIQYNTIKYDIENEKSKDKAQSKLAYLNRWKSYVCEFQQVRAFTDSYFIQDDDLVCEQIRKLKLNEGISSDILLIECLMFEAYSSVQIEGSSKKPLKLSSDYIKDILCDKYGIFEESTLKKIKSYISSNSKKINNTNEKIALAVVSSAILTVATGGAASAFAPAIAVALVGESFVGLSGAALTSASLAFIGGGSLAAGGLGMAGGTVAIATGGAIIGALSSTSASVAANLLIDGVSFKSCIKMITICDVFLEQKDSESLAAIDDALTICEKIINTNQNYLQIVNETLEYLQETEKDESNIDSVERNQKINEYKKVKKNIEKNLKYYNKTVKFIKEKCEKAEKK